MADNTIDVLLPYFAAENDINYWDVIQLTDKYSNIDQNVYETTEEFWNIMPHYMLHFIMSSHPESRKIYEYKPRSNSLSNMLGQTIQFDQRHPIETYKKEIHTNPMDVFIYVFRKSSLLMRQIIVNQVSKCQLSLPLIIQDPITHKALMFPFSYENLTKSYITSEGQLRSFHVSDEKLIIISFIRIGKSKIRIKSKLMNKLLGFNHSCFFNRECSGSSKTRLLYDGTIDMNWYLPGGPNDKLFEDPLTFLNLRGNAFDFKTQLAFICEVSTMVGIILSYNDIITEDKDIQELVTLTTSFSDKICFIFTDDHSDNQEINNIYNFQMQLTNFILTACNVIISGNLEERAVAIRTSIKYTFSQSISPIKLSITDFSKICKDKNLDIIFEDEFVELGIENCKSRMNALNYISLSTDLKQLSLEEYMPLQHEGWKKFAQADRKQHKLRNRKDVFSIARGIFENKFALSAARYIQYFDLAINKNHRIALKDFRYIIINSKDPEDVIKMFTLLRIELEKWKLVFQDSKTINVQHFIRELGQYYEMCCDIGDQLNSIRKHICINHILLPQLFARLMLLGEPLEIFDGETQHIPLTWVQDVLSALADEIGHDKKVFVLGVIGIQSSGKSTLLNTMFGLQFPVASGRCTRGVSMQIISVDNQYAYVLNYDYLVILDSEGLKSMEDSNQDLKSHDNEFTTLMIGLSDLCIINIMGENFMEWKDIFQTIIISLIKLKSSTKRKPKCLFVHQNISDLSARENLKEGYQKFILNLDEVTQFISSETKSNPVYTKFTDVVEFDINESIYHLSSLYSIPPPMSIVSKDYVNAVQRLKNDVISKFGRKYCTLTLPTWIRKLNTVWKSTLNENFVSSYKEILERIYYSEFEIALHKWSQNYVYEMEKELLLCKDQILNANCEDVMKNFECNAAAMEEKCKTILVSDENEFKQYYFVSHSQRHTFNRWKSHSEQHFKNTRLDHQIRTKEKLSLIFTIAERNHKLFNDFYGKRDLILEKATKTKDKLLLSYKIKCGDQEMFDQFYENEWHNWTSDLKLLEHEIPCVNFIFLLKNEMNTLTSKLQIKCEEMNKIRSFFELLEENNCSLDIFVIGENHYRMTEQNGQEIHIACEYYSWLDYVFRKEDKDFDTNLIKKTIDVVNEDISFLNCCIVENYFSEECDNCANSANSISENTKGLVQKIYYLKIRISEDCDHYIKEIMNQEFSCHFEHIIKIILNSVQEFNNKEIRVQIEKVFIYELALFLCAKLIFKFKNEHKPNQMDSLKAQLKSQFMHYYNQENYSSSLACANGLANILLEKMNLHVAEQIQFLVINDFSNSNTFSVSSKCHLQTKVLTDLVNESSFDQYLKYIHEPNQAMKDWIIQKFQKFCKQDSSISRINSWYEVRICKHINIYRKALQESLKFTTPESTANYVVIENSNNSNINIDSDWKAKLHKILEGKHARQFKLSDLDVLLIEPHEITKPSEFVSFFSDSLQKQSDRCNFASWIETYLMADLLTTFSVTICLNLFYCDEHCPLCNEPCLSNINSSEHKHYCGSFHRPLGLNGWFKLDSEEFIGYDCTDLKGKDESTSTHKNFKLDLRKQMSENWDNSGKHHMIESVYWEWVMCNFKDELADHYQYKINGKAIKAWSNLTKSQVLHDLQQQMNDFHSPAFMWRTKKKIRRVFSLKNY